MLYDESDLNTIFGIEGEDIMEMDDYEPVYSNFRGRPGMHSEEGKRDIAKAVGERSSVWWRLHYKDGTSEEVYNLEKWCRDKGWDASNLKQVGKPRSNGKGYIRSYHGIIRYEQLKLVTSKVP